MKDLINEYLKISGEIENYHDLILEEAKQDLRIKELYKGCQILFSPLIKKPEFLLIGFNPGGGYAKWHGKIAQEFEPMQALEYYLNKHSLGEQTKSLFSMAGKEKELEESTVKINFYPWATINVADFKEFMKLLPSDLSSKLFNLSRVWTKALIDSIQPKYIICEGFKALDEMQVLFPERSDNYKTENLRSFQTLSGLKVLGYKRNQGSILDKQTIALSIKQI